MLAIGRAKFENTMRNQYLKSQKMDFPLYFQILLGQWQGVILEIPYRCFRVFSPFLPNKLRLGGFFLQV